MSRAEVIRIQTRLGPGSEAKIGQETAETGVSETGVGEPFLLELQAELQRQEHGVQQRLSLGAWEKASEPGNHASVCSLKAECDARGRKCRARGDDREVQAGDL